MHKSLGAIAGISVTLLLLLGFLSSTYASFTGNSFAYAEKADTLPIRMLALVVLISAILAGIFYKSGAPD